MPDKAKILIVEDEAIIARDLQSTLENLGFEVTGITNNRNDTIDKIKKNKPDLILMDVVLKDDNDGIMIASTIRKKDNIPIVYLTAYADNSVIERAQETEPYGYIIKPYDHRELYSAISFALYKHKTDQQLKENFEKMSKSLESTVTALATAVETRDPYTAGHQRRVTQLAGAIAEEMHMPGSNIQAIRIAAIIHDIGKIHVPAEILSKPAKLTEPEYEIVQTHSQIGYDILKNIDFPWPIADIVLQHHERLDGSGYLHGLSDDSILLEAQVIAVADVTEAMLSHRPYRPAHNLETTLHEITVMKSTKLNPDAVHACILLFKNKSFELKK